MNTGQMQYQVKDVCAINCQNNTFKSQYENGTKGVEGGAWNAGKIDTLKIGVTAAKWAGRGLLGLAVAGDVIDVATAPAGQRVQRAVSDGASLAGAIAGGEVGSEIGFEIGAAVGSLIPGVGTVVVGAIGGVVGGVIGSGVAAKAVNWVGSLF